MAADFIKNLASDLLRLEVNTIIKQNMTAEKIPANKRVLLRKLAQNYRETLAEYGFAHFPEDPVQASDDGKVFRWRYGGEFSFEEISKFAKRASLEIEQVLKTGQLNQHQYSELSSRQKILMRIRNQSSNIVGIFKLLRREFAPETLDKADEYTQDALQENYMDKHHSNYARYKNGELPASCVPFRSNVETQVWNNDLDWNEINTAPQLDLTPDTLSLIYKAYEIGTEQIVLQTVIQIDGDVASYVTPTYLNLPEQTKEVLMGIHNRSINTSTQFWNTLFTTVVNLAGRTFNQIFGRK